MAVRARDTPSWWQGTRNRPGQRGQPVGIADIGPSAGNVFDAAAIDDPGPNADCRQRRVRAFTGKDKTGKR